MADLSIVEKIVSIALFILLILEMASIVRKNKTVLSAAIGHYIITGLIGILILVGVFGSIASGRFDGDLIIGFIVIAVLIIIMLPFHYLNKKKECNKLELWAGHISTLGHLVIVNFVILYLIMFNLSYYPIESLWAGPVLAFPFYILSTILLGFGYMKRRKENK